MSQQEMQTLLETETVFPGPEGPAQAFSSHHGNASRGEREGWNQLKDGHGQGALAAGAEAELG